MGIHETPKGSNRGVEVDKYNAFFKLKAVPWCGTFGSEIVRENNLTPYVQSARAISFAVNGHSIMDIVHNIYIPKPGDYRVKTRRGGNHIDFIVKWDTLKQEGIVVGGNVSDAVTPRKVTIKSMIADGTTDIVPVNYK